MKPKAPGMKSEFGATAPMKGKKKKVPMKGDMGGLLGVTSKKPEADGKLQKQQSAARVARLSGKLI